MPEAGDFQDSIHANTNWEHITVLAFVLEAELYFSDQYRDLSSPLFLRALE